MKLHLGCGPVYLKDYINVDIKADHHYQAKERPDIVEKNLTTLDKYYKDDVTRVDFVRGTYHKREVVCDMFADVRKLPVRDNAADEVVAVQIFEHFAFEEGERVLRHWKDKLVRGGKLHLDIPDLEGTLRIYQKAKNQGDRDWVVRLLYGSQKNKYGLHKAMYSKFTIKRLLTKVGFVNVTENNIIQHNYPVIRMDAFKTRARRG